MDCEVDSTALRELTVGYIQGMSFGKLWRKIGGTLEVLVESGSSMVCYQVDAIKKHCGNLTSISLQGEVDSEVAEVAFLLAWYGARLEYAYLRDMSEEHLVEESGYGTDNELDEFLDSIVDLPVLEELIVDCTMPQDMLKTRQKRGVYWKRQLL